MKHKLFAFLVFALTAVGVASYPFWEQHATAQITPVDKDPNDEQPRIQVAILLDTSGSMSGLINQTREQLWQMVNRFADTTRDGVTPALEVAVYEYGNSGLSRRNGFVRQVAPFTRELDEVSAALFSLTTRGGDEYCGQVIQSAVTELDWSRSDEDIKAIFIAGNEPFTQGPVPFQAAIAQAKTRGVTVNTIHAGDANEGAQSGWRDGALLAGGDYMSIDHNHRIAHFDAPQDGELAELNRKLNSTYVPFGDDGAAKRARQEEQDRNYAAISASQVAERARSKASALYDNSGWDLIDALAKGMFDLDEVETQSLPEEMQRMDRQEQQDYVAKQAAERKRIKAEIGRLSEAREAYVAGQRAAAAGVASTVEDAMMQAIEKEAVRKNYELN